MAEDHAVVKEGVCEDFIAKSQSVEIAHIVLVLLSENARAFLHVGWRASGLPRRGPFAHVGHSCGPRVRALCARVGRVDGLRENWFSFFHQISKCFFSNLVLS